MSFLDRIGSTFKGVGAALTTANPLMGPQARYPMGISDWTFRSDAQNAYLTSAAVFTCVTCWGLHYPQVRFQVTKGREPGGDPWPDHPAQRVLDQPNEDMDMSTFGINNVVYIMCGGAAQIHLCRNDKRYGSQLIALRPYSTQEIRPVPVAGRSIGRESWIDHYAHQPLQGGGIEPVERKDVLSLAFASRNPLQPQLSVSPFAAAFLDVQADVELTKFPLELMKQGAFVSLLYSLPESTATMPNSVFEQIKGDIEQGWTGQNKFNPMVTRGGVKAEMLTSNFRDLEFSKMGERPEVRICTVSRVPIMYAGFSAGLGASTYDNIKLSRIGFVRDAVLGLATLHAKALTGAFQKENWQNHPYGNGDSDFTIELDLSGVLALQDEQLDQRKMSTMEYNAGQIDLNESRRNIPGVIQLPQGVGDQFKPAQGTPAYPTLQETA